MSRWEQGTPGGLAGEQAVVTNVTTFGVRGAQLVRELHLSIAPEGKHDERASVSQYFSCFRL